MSDIPGFDQVNDHRVRVEIIEEIELPVPIWENVQHELHGAILRAGQLEGQLSATQDERDRLLKRVADLKETMQQQSQDKQSELMKRLEERDKAISELITPGA